MMESGIRRAADSAARLGCKTANASAENLKACSQSPKHCRPRLPESQARFVEAGGVALGHDPLAIRPASRLVPTGTGRILRCHEEARQSMPHRSAPIPAAVFQDSKPRRQRPQSGSAKPNGLSPSPLPESACDCDAFYRDTPTFSPCGSTASRCTTPKRAPDVTAPSAPGAPRPDRRVHEGRPSRLPSRKAPSSRQKGAHQKYHARSMIDDRRPLNDDRNIGRNQNGE